MYTEEINHDPAVTFIQTLPQTKITNLNLNGLILNLEEINAFLYNSTFSKIARFLKSEFDLPKERERAVWYQKGCQFLLLG